MPNSAPQPSSELALRVLQHMNSAAVLVMDRQGLINFCNLGAERLLHTPSAQLLGQDARNIQAIDEELRFQIDAAVQAPDQTPDWQAELSMDTPRGRKHTLWHVQILPGAQRSDPWLLVASGLDVTAEREARERDALQTRALHQLVYEDELTGLMSRHAAREYLINLIDQGRPFGLLNVKLREFSLLKDNFGPEGADAVLKAAAQALQQVVGHAGVVARSTGVEFHIIMPDGGEIPELQRMGRSILSRFSAPIVLPSAELVLGVSVGIAIHPLHGAQLEELLRNVGTALHSAQEEGGRVMRVYEPRMHLRARERLWLDHHLRKALELQQLELHFQPKIGLQGEIFPSVEALLRWRHPKRGLIRPDLFIARAESTGQINSIGRWVIVSAAAQAAQWASRGIKVRIAVNISARQFSDPDLLRWLSECQRVAQGLLDVELTESSVIDDEQATQAFMQECRMLGFKVFLDDFGTGFSSLAQLARLPIDVIKLDRSFISSSAQAGRSQALMRSIVTVARELDLQVIAEGVETDEQAQFLRGIGVHGAQGWLYAAAMPAADYMKWLTSREAAISGASAPSPDATPDEPPETSATPSTPTSSADTASTPAADAQDQRSSGG